MRACDIARRSALRTRRGCMACSTYPALWADTAARALCVRVHATLHGGASFGLHPRAVAWVPLRHSQGALEARDGVGIARRQARCGDVLTLRSHMPRLRCDRALPRRRKKSARKSAAAAAASADSQPSEQEQLDDAMGQHWDLSDDIGKVLAFHLSHAPDTASAARGQMSTGAVRDACHACAGGLGAPAAESLWRCVTLAAGAHAPCGVVARAVPGFAEAFRDARRYALRAAAPLLLPDGGTSALLASHTCTWGAVTHFAWTRLSWHHAVPVAGVVLASHMPLISILREVTNVAQTRVVDNHTAHIRTSVLYSTKSEDGFALLPSMPSRGTSRGTGAKDGASGAAMPTAFVCDPPAMADAV
ncbi:hypothetical protein PPROV_000299000 [Pycnococcus provasolii]|uniref:Uncharacterized protein n=1 Tax=Pycnococcus provasolii TaxID=41880 RepID=A0A830HA91_9CHLO|nr:hypothetical protein PPROV_000299000 [Pycnococcus provasolii]